MKLKLPDIINYFKLFDFFSNQFVLWKIFPHVIIPTNMFLRDKLNTANKKKQHKRGTNRILNGFDFNFSIKSHKPITTNKINKVPN